MSQSNSEDNKFTQNASEAPNLARLGKLAVKQAPKPQQKNVIKFGQGIKLNVKIVNETDKKLVDLNEFKKGLIQVMKKDENPDKLQTVAKSVNPVPKSVKPAPVPKIDSPAPSASDAPSASSSSSDNLPTIKLSSVAPKMSKSRAPQSKLTGILNLDVPNKALFNDISVDKRMDDTKLNMGKHEMKNAYYPNDRKVFYSFMNNLFKGYKDEIKESNENATCEYDQNAAFSLMPHQKIIRDYMNVDTPYRGILLFHGLGSGKTCSSIALAEAMKTDKDIIVMTPASLKKNYQEELKKCGDLLYRKNLEWDFVKAEKKSEVAYYLSSILRLPIDYIHSEGGAWLVNYKGEPNYDKLGSSEKKSLDAQIDKMITFKYKFINYNGLQTKNFQKLVNDHSKKEVINREESKKLVSQSMMFGGAPGNKSGVNYNIFDDKVVIIDEIHNLVSRIVNKLNSKHSIPFRLYELLLRAKNVKIIGLSGTPIINYPNEIAVLFNILRGNINLYNFALESKKGSVDTNAIEKTIKDNARTKGIVDYVRADNRGGKRMTLTVTRNPPYFENKYEAKGGKQQYKGLERKERYVSDSQFNGYIRDALEDIGVSIVPGSTNPEEELILPDNLDVFKNEFYDKDKKLTNIETLKRRITGLTSYFRSAQENLMPAFNEKTDIEDVLCEMSPHQLEIYERARASERDKEKRNKKKRLKNEDEEVTSSYRVFSRAFCNFVFPTEIKRPMPGHDIDIASLTFDDKFDELALDGADGEELINYSEGKYDADQVAEMEDAINMIVAKPSSMMEEVDEGVVAVLSPIEKEVEGGGDEKKEKKEKKESETTSKTSVSKDDKIEVACPTCDRRLRVPSTYSGGVRCPECETRFDIEGKVEKPEVTTDEAPQTVPQDDLWAASDDDILECPKCTRKLKVPFERRPAKARCPACETIFEARTE